MATQTPDNGRSRDAGQPPRETLLIADRAGRPEHTPEAEPVVLRATDRDVTFILDDGEVWVFDRAELASFVAPDAA